MKQSVIIGEGLSLDVQRLLETKLLVQANSGGGKSWLLRRIFEQTANHVQQLIIDPEGEFPTLREKHDFVICAAHDADAIAHPRTAALLARRLLETRVSAVLDIYDLKAHERQAFVKNFLDALINAPKSLWHPVLIGIDEAHIFAPESGESEARAAVIDLATRGRKRGQCLLAATTRLSKLHKDVAAEMQNKLIGRTGLDIDVKRASDELGMTAKQGMEALRKLRPGHFYAFGPALSDVVTQVAVGAVATTHPKAGQRLLAPPPKASSKILKVLDELKDLPTEAEKEIRTLEDAKKEIATLRREVTLANKRTPAPAAPAAPKIVKVPAFTDKQIGRLEKLFDRMVKEAERHGTAMSFLWSNFNEVGTAFQKAMESVASVQAVEGRMHQTRSVGLVKVPTQLPSSQRVVQPLTDPGTPLPAGERAVLTAAAQHPEGVTREQATVLTGYKRSTRDAYIARLTTRGYITVGNLIVATDAGIAALGSDFTPLPTGAELREHWLRELPEGERKVLQWACEAYPSAVTRDALTEATGYKRSTRDAYIARLYNRRLIDYGNGGIVASKTLFN